MKRLKTVVCVVSVFSVSLLANAAVWYGLEDGDVWSDPTNWTSNSVPGANDWAEIIYDFPKVCILDSDAGTINTLHIAAGGAGASMIIKNGGNLTVTGGDVSPGWNNNGSLTIETGGSLTCNGLFTVGMYADVAGSYAHLFLQGGILTVNNVFYHGIYFGGNPVDVRSEINAGILDLDALVLDRGVMDIANGTVIVNGDYTGAVAAWIASGQLTAFGGTGTIFAEVVDGRTYITAVPEPASMALLAMGGVMALRRKNA
jgi:hypothetical protein